MAKGKKATSKIHETFGDFIEFYSMAKDLYLDDLTNKDLPANERLPKNLTKRLALSVKEVTVGSFDEAEDECVYIRFKIRGSEQDIGKVNELLRARYGGDEQEKKD